MPPSKATLDASQSSSEEPGLHWAMLKRENTLAEIVIRISQLEHHTDQRSIIPSHVQDLTRKMDNRILRYPNCIQAVVREDQMLTSPLAFNAHAPPNARFIQLTGQHRITALIRLIRQRIWGKDPLRYLSVDAVPIEEVYEHQDAWWPCIIYKAGA